MQQPVPVVVFSHLRWDFVYQRPQHLLSRLAARRRIVVIEEPIPVADGSSHWTYSTPVDNVLICRPHTSVNGAGFADEQLPVLRSMMEALVAEQNLHNALAWFYTPMALPLAETLKPSAVVYDCMDELSAFRGAPAQMVERENALMRLADVVFTGGPSLFRAKKGRHANVHCFPSSVDAAHFGQARKSMTDPGDQAELPHPRLGFFGVLDERLDLPLLDAVARAHPEWQLVLVGPVVKIDAADLPRHANIHYLGQRPYADLPAYLAGWDVCILPFARNDATRFISPTKTLEYMAAERPLVSTPITDVAEPYGHIVYLGESASDFIAACERALGDSIDERSTRVAAMREVLAKTSWDATVQAIEELLSDVLARKLMAHRTRNGHQTASPPNRPTATMRQSRDSSVVIVGAGPTGLSAAYHLGDDALLLEQNDKVGGWCRSIEAGGFTFDYAGHIMFSNDAYVHELYERLLKDNVHWQDREAWIYSKGVYTRYPFQGALYGLPHSVIKECIVGAIEARYGNLKKNASPSDGHTRQNGHHGNGKSGNGACKPAAITDCCADGVLESTAPLARANGKSHGVTEPAHFEEFIYKVWGAGIAKHFAIPYNRKLWAVPLTEMETSWLGGRVPLPDLEEMIEGALRPVPRPMGPNARFGYPLRGGFQALMNGFLPHVRDRLWLGARVAAVSPRDHRLKLTDDTELPYEHLISTMPLPVLVRLSGSEAPREVRLAAAGLRHVSVRCVQLGIGRERLTDKHWIYFPEDTVFHRIFVQGNASPHCNAPGGFGLTCEITYSPHKPLPCDGDALIQRCIADCHRVGIFEPSDPVWVSAQCDLPYAYVVYDHARPRNVAIVRDWLAEHDIHLAGRYSEWEYYNSDHAFLAGKRVAERVRQLQTDRVGALAR